MTERRLNLAAIRALKLSRRTNQATVSPQSRTSNGISLSRRDFFGLAALTGFSLPPALSLAKSVIARSKESFEHTATERRIVFRLYGQDRWVIDCDRFGGRPRLVHHRNRDEIRLALLDAFFPGTRLPADFDCTIRKASLTWQMDLRFHLRECHCRAPFVRWLAQLEPATGELALAESVCSTGQDESLVLAGNAVGEFRPDWTLRLKGSRIARIQSHALDITSDELTLALLRPDATSLVENPAMKRTLLRLARDTAPWRVSPHFECGQQGCLACPENSFSSLHMETWDEGVTETGVALLAFSEPDSPRPMFETSGTGPIQLSQPARLPLMEARYARTTQWPSGRQHHAFVAQFSEESTWLAVNGCQLAVGARLETPPFELTQQGSAPAAIRCEPGLHHAHVPLEGAITEPMQVSYGATVQLVQTAPLQKSPRLLQKPAPSLTPLTEGPAQSGATQQLQREQILKTPGVAGDLLKEKLSICATDYRCALRIPGPSTVSVVRPDDLLHLKFEFRNLTLQIPTGQPPLLVRTAGTPAQLVVYFPPQHIGEEAFRDPRESPQLPKPVKALIAGWSQLVFEIPANITAIPYTLPALLDWSQFQQVTARAAAPPPPPLSPLGLIKQRVPGIMRQSPVAPRSVPPLKRRQSLPGHGTVGEPEWYRVTEATYGFVQARAMVALSRESVRRLTIDQPARVVPAQLSLQQAEKDLRAFAIAPVPPKREDLRNITAIEAPFRLFLSPSPMAGWRHEISERPTVRNGRLELWHTRLGVRRQLPDGRWIVDESDDWYRTLRAIWSPDHTRPVVYSQPTPQNPFRMSLDARDRHELVELMANSTKDPSGWPDRVARADYFMMTSLGAWMKLHYAAPRIAGIDLVEWQHIATMGRDQYVKVVREGYLFPFGHKAELITITERIFEEVTIEPGGVRMLALLKQREFIVVREPLRSYTGREKDSFPSHGRKFPYQQLRMTTLVTPNLDDMTQPPSMIARDKVAFWPLVNGEPVRFHFIGQDHDGRSSEFAVPLIFVSATAAEQPQNTSTLLVSVAKAYEPRSTANLRGQSIAYASPMRGEDTILHTASQTFNAEMPPPGAFLKNQPLFFPILVKAEVRVPAVSQLLGNEASIKIAYATPYLRFEWDPVQNKGEVFAEIIEKFALGFPPDKVGRLASPNLDLVGLSRKSGPVGGLLQDAAMGNFNPLTFFKKAQNPLDPQQLLSQAQILGGIFLGDIIKAVAGALPPQFVTETLPPDTPDTLKLIKTGYQMGTQSLKPDPLNIFQPLPQANLTITSSILTRISKPGTPPREPEFASVGTLTNFEINLFTFLILTFKELRFTKLPGKKLDVTADLADDPLRFGGPLKFVDTLRKFIPAQGFKDPPSLDITPSGITAGYSLALPTIAVGVFSLENLKLSAGLSIPFTNTPVSVRFAFSSRKDPFNVIVSLFGGGGFIGLELDTSGIRSVEAAIEFGGKVSLDLVVAKASVVVMAGIYFKVSREVRKVRDISEVETERNISRVELEGYLRAGGSCLIFGFIMVSVEFKLSLTYLDDGSRSVWGRVSLMVKVEIAFFSVSVELEFEKRFAGSSSTAALDLDPLIRPVSYGHVRRTQFRPTATPTIGQPAKIADLVSVEDWNRYAAAFA